MPKLRPISYTGLAGKLHRAGYIPVRKSKHTIYFHPIRHVTIPVPHKHARDIQMGLLHKLIKEMGMSLEEFNAL